MLINRAIMIHCLLSGTNSQSVMEETNGGNDTYWNGHLKL
jgi:hypothetical protein